ncbi:MAG: septum formation inhibitor-activating ATPase [Gemmatimonas sp.]|nr:septum formation inhibitor-activating ATPase [Gemmatimonas sp.]
MNPKLGGVDPLGLRQINFDLMDGVLPGLNNVARHIRPFVVVTWAWRRASQLSQSLGTAVVQSERLQDFVDRIEVLYVLSQFMRDPKVDLPGRDFLKPLFSQSVYSFGGENWAQRRETRRNSTGLSSALNYGPGLKSLGWLAPHREFTGIMMPRPEIVPALDALEAKMHAMLGHDAFNKLGDITVSRFDVEGWADAWALTEPTEQERRVMAEGLFGTRAPAERQLAGELLKASVTFVGSNDKMDIRRAMTGLPSRFTPEERLCRTRDAWRLVQVRQLFRLSMEGLLFWIIRRLDGGPNSTATLVRIFLERIPADGMVTVEQWLQGMAATAKGPLEMVEAIEDALRDPAETDLPRSLMAGLAFCLTSEDDAESAMEREDRLPLRRARREAHLLGASTVEEFVRHAFESWVLAQHTYWSVGRGLADARARGRTLLRLRVVLDEGGWALAPGVSPGGPPAPARDRLDTAISLATECGVLDLRK